MKKVLISTNQFGIISDELPLTIAARYGYANTLDNLIKNGTNPFPNTDTEYAKPFNTGGYFGHGSCLKVFLQYEPSEKDKKQALDFLFSGFPFFLLL